MSNAAIGVLVMSYGTPESLESVEEYYTHIRRGSAPSAEQLKELTDRYEAIAGGVFPLRENTDRQVSGLQDKLDTAEPGRFRCYQGLKHARPYIEDGVAAMAKDGVKRAVGIVLAPHYSTMSIASYNKRALAEAQKHGIELVCVESYHLHPSLIEALAERVREGVEAVSAKSGGADVKVLFSAHSLPERIREAGDPYEEQLLETSRAVAEAAGAPRWQFTWQSAGRTAEPWLGPDILETMDQLAGEGERALLAAPVGFVSDHLEVLYDLDIEAMDHADKLGVAFGRIRMLNSDPLYMETLADCIREAAAKLPS
ncbi:ferrochelatase [Paenibacillus albicereus]|uniref:Coproporphyrin III ferrochelatase n=1 Tax=Paenibacillus albicereus TaxID=2726185 RepID=A0A6H2GVW9_9BACL|nr:ferrochelatase [Paenibacillus albicereus]QJC51571.1 ferrochelatase [Paenibacillus albicereus]